MISFGIINACKAPHKSETDAFINGYRVISFAGYQWKVKSSKGGTMAPGNNYFSDSPENVWVDGEGRLHLRITHKNGKWYCAQVNMMRSYGYGKYTFIVNSGVDELNKQVVGGMYTYQNDSAEIDIEFSKWSLDSNRNSQFVTQPGSIPANKRRYDLDLAGRPSTHSFRWQPGRIDFESYRGVAAKPAVADIIQQWTYTGRYVPVDADETVRINLWLFRGLPPSDEKETEMVLSGFRIQ